MSEITVTVAYNSVVPASQRCEGYVGDQPAIAALIRTLPAIVVKALEPYRLGLTTAEVPLELSNERGNAPSLWVEVVINQAQDLSEDRVTIRDTLKFLLQEFLRSEGIPDARLAFVLLVDGCGCAVLHGRILEW